MMQSTKDKILNAVISYLKEGRSLEGISLTMIASDAAIGKSTLYEYFNSKEEMICETFKYLINYYDQLLHAPLKEEKFKECLSEQIKRILFVMNDAKIIMETIINKNEPPFKSHPEINKHFNYIQENISKRFTEIFTIAFNEGIIKLENAKQYNRNVLKALIFGLVMQYVNKEMDISEDNLVNLIYEKCLLLF